MFCTPKGEAWLSPSSMYVCMYVCMYVYVYVYIYIYIFDSIDSNPVKAQQNMFNEMFFES